jgi:hypothetical protein
MHAVSNICMDEPSRWLTAILLTLLSSLVSAIIVHGQDAATPMAPDELYFSASPRAQLVAQGEPVILVLEIYSRSEEPIFASRLSDGDFVEFKVIGPDGKEVPWRGERRSNSSAHTLSDFVVLEQYHEISAKRTISFKDGAGFVFDKPGQYSVAAEYSLGPPETLAQFAGETRIRAGILRSTKAAFCIEACVLGPLPGPIQVHSNATQPALDAVRLFYAAIFRYRPLGIPQPKKVLWPFLSKRLAQELDSLESCDADYYRRFGDVLKANQYKPATPWLEDGLFTGPNDPATPIRFSILGSRAIGENRVDVHVGFTSKQTSCCGQPAEYDHFDGVATAILENHRWVIDDYVAMYENDELRRLSDGYRQCQGGQWVGEPPY